MVAVGPLLLLASVFPRVEDPWPDSVGLGFPIAMAGAGGIVASVLFAEASEARRDRAVRHGGLWGFWLGTLLYALSALDQIASG